MELNTSRDKVFLNDYLLARILEDGFQVVQFMHVCSDIRKIIKSREFKMFWEMNWGDYTMIEVVDTLTQRVIFEKKMKRDCCNYIGGSIFRNQTAYNISLQNSIIPIHDKYQLDLVEEYCVYLLSNDYPKNRVLYSLPTKFELDFVKRMNNETLVGIFELISYLKEVLPFLFNFVKCEIILRVSTMTNGQEVRNFIKDISITNLLSD